QNLIRFASLLQALPEARCVLYASQFLCQRFI
ncbi:MAG: hypothetical protein ACI9LM_002338, partial [Alteromonadaceae bacterium]